MTSVLIGSPVKQKPAVLKFFLDSLEELDISGLEVGFAFIDDNDTPSDLIKAFAGRNPRTAVYEGDRNGRYLCDNITHYWTDPLIWKVANYKNRLIQLAKDMEVDYLFLADSDLVLHPYTLKHLILRNKPIVAEVFWTKWRPEHPELPQVWLSGQYQLHHAAEEERLTPTEVGRRQQEFLSMLKKPGTYRVGGLGACTLISREALRAGVSFAKINNLDYQGEDRHFCIRAEALGIPLYADTFFPPYHIYRESCLAEAAEYKRSFDYIPRLTLAMLVRNEAGRYLEQVLRHAARFVDNAVIVDDASTDETVEVCRRCLGHLPLTLIENRTPQFVNEAVLRKQLWSAAVQTSPDWILILDADEQFEDKIIDEIKSLTLQTQADVWNFRLYDMWRQGYYRDDGRWRAHLTYRPFMVRHRAGFKPMWHDTPQHCGRFPKNITDLRGAASEMRVKHWGWIKPADRWLKYKRYKALDPEGIYGIKEQYVSILDPAPRLAKWQEN